MYASKPEEILRAVNASSAQFERKIKEMETDLNTLKRINAQLRVRCYLVLPLILLRMKITQVLHLNAQPVAVLQPATAHRP